MNELRVARTSWRPLPRPDCTGVEVTGVAGHAGLAVAMLRFAPQATIDEHAAPYDIDVRCISGRGWVSVGDRTVPLGADDEVRWPAGIQHRLWTDSDPMVTLMIEHRPTNPPPAT